jgi:chromosome segregation ATPase
MENQSTVKDVKAAGEPENKIIAGTDGGDKVKTSTNAVSSKEATAQPQNETEKMLKDIKKKFKNLSKLTMDNFNTDVSEGERLNKLFDATNKIASYVNSMEEYNYILNKLQGANRLEKEMINAETVKLSNYKAKLEKLCREFQANNNSIKDTNKKYVEEETKRREELKKNFESSLGEIAVKLEEQSKGAQEQHQENEELRAKLKDKIQQFEAREKEVLEEIKKKDDENEDRTKGILSKLREIEKDAQASFELKANIDRVEKK